MRSWKPCLRAVSRLSSWATNVTFADMLRWLTECYAPAGMKHALVSFADPFTLRAWAGVEVDGLPSLRDQVRLFGESVLAQLP